MNVFDVLLVFLDGDSFAGVDVKDVVILGLSCEFGYDGDFVVTLLKVVKLHGRVVSTTQVHPRVLDGLSVRSVDSGQSKLSSSTPSGVHSAGVGDSGHEGGLSLVLSNGESISFHSVVISLRFNLGVAVSSNVVADLNCSEVCHHFFRGDVEDTVASLNHTNASYLACNSRFLPSGIFVTPGSVVVVTGPGVSHLNELLFFSVVHDGFSLENSVGVASSNAIGCLFKVRRSWKTASTDQSVLLVVTL